MCSPPPKPPVTACRSIECNAGVRELAAGPVIHINGNEIHVLSGIENASLLLTIALETELHLEGGRQWRRAASIGPP